MQKCGFALFALVVVINTFMSLPKMGYSMMLVFSLLSLPENRNFVGWRLETASFYCVFCLLFGKAVKNELID